MPDRYMRQKQVLALDLQERCLSYLRGGGEMPEVVTAPLVQETPSLLEHLNNSVEEAKTQVSPQVNAASSESESEADSEAALVQSPKRKSFWSSYCRKCQVWEVP